MRVTVRLFAMLRERAGTGQLELELPEGARVSDALAAVADLAGGLPLVMAVNRRYADVGAPLAPGDELALIPPVSGGQRPARAGDGLHVAPGWSGCGRRWSAWSRRCPVAPAPAARRACMSTAPSRSAGPARW